MKAGQGYTLTQWSDVNGTYILSLVCTITASCNVEWRKVGIDVWYALRQGDLSSSLSPKFSQKASVSLSQKHHMRQIRLCSPHFIHPSCNFSPFIVTRERTLLHLMPPPPRRRPQSLEWRHYVIPSLSVSVAWLNLRQRQPRSARGARSR